MKDLCAGWQAAAAGFVAEHRAGRFATDHGAAGKRSVRPKVVPA